MVNIFFKRYFQENYVFPSAFVQYFLGLFRNCLRILIYLINQLGNLMRQGLYCFWLQILCLKFFPCQGQTIVIINPVFFLRVPRFAALLILSVLSADFLCSFAERHVVSEVSNDALERQRQGKFGFL